MNWKFFLDRLSATLHFFVVYNFKFQVGTLDGHEVFAAIYINDLALGLLVATCYDLNEVSFNASLLKELRAIAFVKKLIEHDMIKDEYKHMYKDLLVHSVRADDMMKEFSVASKFETDWDFLITLRDAGREGMKLWLEEHFDNIGERASVDLNEEFLTEKDEKKHFFSKDRTHPKKKKS